VAEEEHTADGEYLTGYDRKVSGPLNCTALRMEDGRVDAVRRMKPSIRCLSNAFVKPHQALDAHSSLAMMTLSELQLLQYGSRSPVIQLATKSLSKQRELKTAQTNVYSLIQNVFRMLSVFH